MLARSGIGGIDRPSAPPGTDDQFSATILTTSANASEERMKNGPLSRAQISDRTAPATAAAKAPAKIPNHGVTLWFRNSIVEVYAPIPKNAAWPNEITPAQPPAIFQASARPAKRNDSTTTSCNVGATPRATQATQTTSRMISDQEIRPRCGSAEICRNTPGFAC